MQGLVAHLRRAGGWSRYLGWRPRDCVAGLTLIVALVAQREHERMEREPVSSSERLSLGGAKSVWRYCRTSKDRDADYRRIVPLRTSDPYWLDDLA